MGKQSIFKFEFHFGTTHLTYSRINGGSLHDGKSALSLVCRDLVVHPIGSYQAQTPCHIKLCCPNILSLGLDPVTQRVNARIPFLQSRAHRTDLLLV